VPWQQLAAAKGAKLRVIPVDDSGQILLDEYRKLLNHRTKLVSITQVSNALGTVTPVKEVVALAHSVGAKALVDGAQSVSHMRIDVQDIGADFFVFSGHKVFGPTGIGVVWGKRAVLEDMPPWQGGGNMIADVTFEKTVYQPIPTSSKPAPAISRTRWAWARRSTTSTASASTTLRATSTNCWCTAPRS
jgi:cysteine desulfurase/selenocysteine lyase